MLVALFTVLGIALCSCSKKEEIPYTTGDTEPEEIADPTKNEKPDQPEFEADKKELSLRWKGSSNQRVIDVPETRRQGKIVLHQ